LRFRRAGNALRRGDSERLSFPKVTKSTRKCGAAPRLSLVFSPQAACPEKWKMSGMLNQERKERALEALKKYRGSVTSEERIASFAAWFVEQESAWKDVKKEPPSDTMLVHSG
jgi:hypothetical protein